MTKDIIIIIGGGGLAGIFSSGVLKAFEEDSFFQRIHSIYGTSAGACTGARFLVKESELGGQTFYTRFNNKKFIRGNFIKYFFQTLKYGKSEPEKVKSVLDFDYFRYVIKESTDKIDEKKLFSSSIPFYVKVFNVSQKKHQYLLAQNPNGYEKIVASASMTPLITESFFINNEEIFDGDTIYSNTDEEIISNNPDKIIIKIQNSKETFFRDFNPGTLLVITILLKALYNKDIAKIYFKGFFKKLFNRKKRNKNIFYIENPDSLSGFCQDEAKLKKAYASGQEAAKQLKKNLRKSGSNQTT